MNTGTVCSTPFGLMCENYSFDFTMFWFGSNTLRSSSQQRVRTSGTYPAVMHAHSLMWFGLLVVAVTLLYRRLMGLTLAAGLAALLYAVDDAHGMPVASFRSPRPVSAKPWNCSPASASCERSNIG